MLAIRAEPPELLLDRTSTDPAPQEVTFQALVLDPRGGPMLYDWRFCPVESNQTCGDFDQRRARAAPEFQPVLDAARAWMLTGQVSGGAGNGGGPGPALTDAGIDRFTVPVAPGLFAYHLVDSGLGLGNGAWASAVLKVQAGSETLTAVKRLVLNARDLSQWNPELAAFGWQVCPASSSESPAAALPGCLPLRPRTANRNPEIAALQVARGALASAPFEPLVEPLVVTAGEKLRLRRCCPPAPRSPSRSSSRPCRPASWWCVDRTEDLIVSWFATAGEFADEQTARQLTKTLDNTFTAPAAPPAGGDISVFVVVRDQRGGVGWSRVQIQLR